MALAGALLQQASAAMAAHVVKPTQHAVAPAQCKQLPSRRIHGQIASRLPELGGGSEHVPVAAKYRLSLSFKQRGIDVIPRVEIEQAWLGCEHRDGS